MNRMGSRELLAELQRRAGYRSRETVEEALDKMKVPEEFKEKYRRIIKSVEENLPTKFQDPGEYMLLDDIFKEIQAAINGIKGPDGTITRLPEIPTFGTVRMGSFSAQIAGSGRGDYLILFASGLFGFANLLAKVIGDSFVLTEDNEGYSFSTDFEQIKIRLKEKREIQKHFDDLMMGYMIRENAHAARQYFPSRELEAIASIIREGMEVFVAAHEYAHLILGHLSADTREIRQKRYRAEDTDSSSAEEERINEIIYNWKDETAADSLGADITMAVMMRKGYDRALAFMGPGTAMLGMWLLEGLENLKEGEDPETPRNSETHPSVILRKHALYEKVKSEEPEILLLMETVENIMQYLWTEFLEFYRGLERNIKDIAKELSVWDLPFEIIQKIIYERK